MLIGLDTEGTGVDHFHGAAPFLVTICNEEWENTFWEWQVDPVTRKVTAPKEDLWEIAKAIQDADELVLQNAKFDIISLMRLLTPKMLSEWPWDKTHDTLLLAHLLASNHAKDLNSLAVEYLAVNISKYENSMEAATKEARDIAKKLGWRIAKFGEPDMPSIKQSQAKGDPGKAWKADTWIPRQLAKRKAPGWKKEWLTVTSEYANVDSSVTVGVFKAQLKLAEERGLLEIYETRRKLMPIVFDMEWHGVPVCVAKIEELETKFKAETDKAGRICNNIAEGMGYELSLPKGGANKNLETFVFDHLKLPPIRNNTKKKTSKPDLDKRALEQYLDTLPSNSKAHLFIKNLGAKRKRDTALTYIAGYRRFGIPAMGVDGASLHDWIIVHPSLNITGTDTLRCSSANPNEQNISKQEEVNLRYMFGPPPGYEWWSLDAKNIELRIPAYESEERELIDLFEKPNEPPYFGSTHLLNFHTIYTEIWDAELHRLQKELGSVEAALAKVGGTCKKKFAATWYQWVKNGGFAVQYGAVDRDDGAGTADRAFHKPGAQALLKARFGRLEQLNQKCIATAERLGYVETMPDRTVNPEHGYPLLCTRNNWGKIKPTVPLNYHVQGTAMWWMGKAMIRTYAQIQEWKRLQVIIARIVMQIHDELVFQFPKAADPVKDPANSNLKYARRLADLMAQGGDDIGVPTPVGIEYNPVSWSEGTTIQ